MPKNNFNVIFKELERLQGEDGKTNGAISVVQELEIADEIKKLCEIVSQTTQPPAKFYTST